MQKYFLMFLCSICLCFVSAEEIKKTFEFPHADAIEVRFSKDTFVPRNHFVVVKQGNDEVFRFFGKDAAEQRILVFGSRVDIGLGKKTNHYHLDFDYAKPVFFSEMTIESIVDYSKLAHLKNRDLKDELYEAVKGHVSLGYGPAREFMFGDFDNKNGRVECVYTGLVLETKSIPDHTIMNTEHTWPKSKGAKSEPAKSDLHHLFPTDSKANSRRSSFAFGEVVRVDWSDGGSSLGSDSKGYTVFSPRPQHRGDVARALFYFSVRYRLNIPSYEESVIKKWHQEDPVDQKEIERNENISRYQKNRNPFIDNPSLVEQINDF